VFSLFRPKAKRKAAPSTDGRLVYAIGDIHGRVDALEGLLAVIRADMGSGADAAQPLLIFLGDYVDRGPTSREVVDLVIKLQADRAFEVIVLKGNHEEAILRFLQEPDFGPVWADYGGLATLASYGVNPPTGRTDLAAWTAASEHLAQAMPKAHLDFYRRLDLMTTVGDYAFVHAGVRPGVALSDQTERDLLWIREDFLSAPGRFEKIIVHGHTPVEEPQLTKHRIGIDTGAYATGVLTAVRLNDQGSTFLQAKISRAGQMVPPLAAHP